MREYSFIVLLAGILFQAGCGKAPYVEIEDSLQMNFLMQYPSSATRATATNFESNDVIGVFVVKEVNNTSVPLQVSGNHANNVSVSFNGTVWTPQKAIYWPTEKVDVYGYYPYMSITSVDKQPFKVQLDQFVAKTSTELSGYEKSDFLWAKTTGVASSQTPVPLKFKHSMSKLVVKLVKGQNYDGALPDNALLYVHNTVADCHIDLSTGAAVKDSFGKPATIKCRKVANDQYEAIIVPQRIETRRPFIEIVVNNISYLVEDNFHFKAGMQHTLNLTINSSPDQIIIDVGGSTGGWN